MSVNPIETIDQLIQEALSLNAPAEEIEAFKAGYMAALAKAITCLDPGTMTTVGLKLMAEFAKRGQEWNLVD